jgi:hypothetical protein
MKCLEEDDDNELLALLGAKDVVETALDLDLLRPPHAESDDSPDDFDPPDEEPPDDTDDGGAAAGQG